MLQVDGEAIPQSKAIERFLSRKFGLLGKTPAQEAQIDALCETVIDMKQAYQKVRGDQEKSDEWFSKTLPESTAVFEKMVPASIAEMAEPTYAHVVIYYYYSQFY